MTPSRLEKEFAFLWRCLDGPPLEREFRFHSQRKWRADFAHLPSRTLIEIEGGAWVGGRHNRGGGFMADVEKYLEAVLGGWRVVWLTQRQLEADTLERLIALLAGTLSIPPAATPSSASDPTP